jgi:hypothetical protein
MNRRQLLIAVKLMFGLLGLAFAYILLIGSGTGERSQVDDESARFTQLATGQTRVLRIEGKPHWVSRMSDEQRSWLGKLKGELVDHLSGCALNTEFCAVSASTQTSGIILSYSQLPPPQLPESVIWRGGFVDPSSGACFDLLGRAYLLGRPSDSQKLQVIEY